MILSLFFAPYFYFLSIFSSSFFLNLNFFVSSFQQFFCYLLISLDWFDGMVQQVSHLKRNTVRFKIKSIVEPMRKNEKYQQRQQKETKKLNPQYVDLRCEKAKPLYSHSLQKPLKMTMWTKTRVKKSTPSEPTHATLLYRINLLQRKIKFEEKKCKIKKENKYTKKWTYLTVDMSVIVLRRWRTSENLLEEG